MVPRVRTTSRTTLLSAPCLTALLLRKSRRVAKSKYVTEVLNQERYLGYCVEVETSADHQPVSQHDDSLPQLTSPFSDRFLRVSGGQSDPITPRSPHSSGGASTRRNPPYIMSRQSASHFIYLNRHLNPSSCNSSRYPTSSLVSRYHSAASLYSLAESDYAFRSTYDDDLVFHSARQSFLDSYCQPVLSRDYASSPLLHLDHSDPANSSIGAEHKSPSVGDDSQGTDSSKDALSSPEDSADKSFQCRGLTSSQITPSSRYQPSDQNRSQPSDQDRSQPSDHQSNDERRFNSYRDGDGEVKRVITDSQRIINCCNESSRIPTATGEVDSLQSNKDHHSEKDPHDALELTRKKVSNSLDEVAIGPIKQRSSRSSQNSSSATAIIPSQINLSENTSIFTCPFMRRLVANFGPGLMAWNNKRKKFQEELQAKIRLKLQNNLNKTSKTTP
ncbi:hypothetical protein VP01_2649g2 [Puccinia sorghi]|uniref:Uncharacterized protein n=1 Tax=Puccinia sorghi TaxID=27349 RepID=A0A0L6V4A7_9BASI|nr:hypothetical protein VP01_2649g2 [Puccinia sorghi]